MKQSNKITQTEFCRQLSQAVRFEIRPAHFAVLIHGWMRKCPDKAPRVSALSMRKRADGEIWLTRTEAHLLALYAGYPVF